MMYFRYWLSARLLEWAIHVVPDDYARYWLTYGIQIAAEGMMNEREE